MSQSLDEKDRKILSILTEHAEYTTRQIAKKTLLPVTTVHNRITKLRKEGIIKRFTIDINHEKTGDNFLAYVLVSVDKNVLRDKKKTQYDILNEMKRLNFVERADIVTGGTDLIVIMRSSGVAEFDDFLLNKFQAIDGVEKTQSLIVIHSGK